MLAAACAMSWTWRAGAADFWFEPGAAGVAAGNDCGNVSSVSGEVRLRRPFVQAGNDGSPVHLADRVHAGDAFELGPDGVVEWTTGHNILAVLGAGARATVSGLRTTVFPDGRTGSRLDIEMEKGVARVQVRLNRERPEAVLVRCANVETLILRGDVEFDASAEWSVTVLAGEAEARLLHPGSPGAVFAMGATTVLTTDGLSKRSGAPTSPAVSFSHETIKAALPPRPVSGFSSEAP